MTPNIMMSWRVKYRKGGSIMTANPVLTYGADTPGAIEEAARQKYGRDVVLLSYERNR